MRAGDATEARGIEPSDLPEVGDEQSVELCREVVGAIEYDLEAPDAR